MAKIKIQGNSKIQGKAVFDLSSATPTYAVTSDVISSDEGAAIVFTLNTTNVEDGMVIPYTITGITQQDLSSGSLTGNFTVYSNTATISISLANDALTEGSETTTLALDNGFSSVSVVVNDTSMAPTYSIARSSSTVNEGSSVTFTLSTTNVANGTVLPYTISGISSTDVTTGSLTGSFTVSNGLATATITMSADQLTEGAETATLTLNNAAASNFVLVNDTSVFTPATISGLQLWLDASDASTLFDATAGGNLVTTDGAAVARWADKSGNNRHATQATANARPLLKTAVKNGRNVIRFDGANDAMASILTVNNPFTFVFVAYPIADISGYRVLLSGNNNNNTSIGYDPSSRAWLYTTTGSVSARTKPTNFELYVGIFNGANSRLIINNNFDNSWATTSTNLTTLNLATNSLNQWYRNDFAECLVYNSVLSNSDINSLKTYLNNKWAIY